MKQTNKQKKKPITKRLGANVVRGGSVNERWGQVQREGSANGGVRFRVGDTYQGPQTAPEDS